MDLKSLSGYLTPDREKRLLMGVDLSFDDLVLDSCKYCLEYIVEPTKYCPECFKKYTENENTCFDCLVRLRHATDMKNVRNIEFSPEFKVKGNGQLRDFSQIFSDENITKVRDFKFSVRDYEGIVKNIKKTALKNLDVISRENEICIDFLSIQDKVLMFSKSFAAVDFKSYGHELGYFEFDRLCVDDRLKNSLLITTLIHELSHFLLNEILSQILSCLLECDKNSYIEAISTFILSYSPLTRLIDEYCAHNVEGRFTIYGYQDYSSFIQIINELDDEMESAEIEITKSIGNTFAQSIRDILESFLDEELREEIKDQFLAENTDEPNYEMLKLENCNKLTDEGFMKAIRLVLSEGFETARLNVSRLVEYESRF